MTAPVFRPSAQQALADLKTRVRILEAVRTGAPDAKYEIKVISDTATLTTGDGQFIFAIPSDLNGFRLSAVSSFVTTVSSAGLPTVQIRNVTDAVDMLTTKVSIDVGEFTSYTATTPAVIDATNAFVTSGDLIAIDVDIAGTGAKGLGVILVFSK